MYIINKKSLIESGIMKLIIKEIIFIKKIYSHIVV